jgi:hypothetical protein
LSHYIFGMINVCTTLIFLIVIVFCLTFCLLASNLDPPDLTLLSSWDYRCDPVCLSLHLFFFFFLWYWGLNSGPLTWASLPALSLWRVFQDRVWLIICLGWVWTAILLISASRVSRITGMSQKHLACIYLYVWKNLS